jgi:hypothetical protein
MLQNGQFLREQLALMSDEALLERVENRSQEFTPEAQQLINTEVANRGGLEAVRRKVEESRASQKLQPFENLAILKRLYPVVVLITYGLFMYAINASLWFYWLCLFALIASLFAVLFRPPFNPEDEIKELTSRAAGDEGPPPPALEPGGERGFQ